MKNKPAFWNPAISRFVLVLVATKTSGDAYFGENPFFLKKKFGFISFHLNLKRRTEKKNLLILHYQH